MRRPEPLPLRDFVKTIFQVAFMPIVFIATNPVLEAWNKRYPKWAIDLDRFQVEGPMSVLPPILILCGFLWVVGYVILRFWSEKRMAILHAKQLENECRQKPYDLAKTALFDLAIALNRANGHGWNSGNALDTMSAAEKTVNTLLVRELSIEFQNVSTLDHETIRLINSHDESSRLVGREKYYGPRIEWLEITASKLKQEHLNPSYCQMVASSSPYAAS